MRRGVERRSGNGTERRGGAAAAVLLPLLAADAADADCCYLRPYKLIDPPRRFARFRTRFYVGTSHHTQSVVRPLNNSTGKWANGASYYTLKSLGRGGGSLYGTRSQNLTIWFLSVKAKHFEENA